ncbi:MAG: nicotinamide-nucleotide amidohydrolase family protein [Gammaproteobacteria bacterium]|nr:MAG: nicotinamide-nucleotide amidohydrolase family protein [Gammaproteobacteria bacterium]
MNVYQVLVERLASELTRQNAYIATAESCTGGWIAKVLTDMPGSSTWFEYGFVSYGNNAKSTMLNVDAALIEEHGAVSSEVVEAMVIGALEASGAQLALAVTGIAGPEGGTPDKPIGTVWFAFAAAGKGVVSACQQFEGDRDTVRRQTVSTALSGVLKYLEKSGG